MMQDAFTVGQGLQVDALAQAAAQDAGSGSGGQIVLIAGAGMVAMAVGDHGALDRAPRVDVEVARWAVQAFRAGDDEVHGNAWAGAYQLRTSQGGEVRTRKRASRVPRWRLECLAQVYFPAIGLGIGNADFSA